MVDLDRKYRPKLDEIIGLENIIKDHLAYLKIGGGPNRIYIGPPGVGKNTLEYAWTTEYFGREIDIDTENDDPDYIEINASKNRGIEMVRELADFAACESDTYNKGVRCKRKIFLNEFENLTPEAKAALKSDMEKYSKNCIYTLCTNYEESIKEDAILSRCAVFRFTRPSEKVIAKWFEGVAKKEKVFFEYPELILDVVKHYNGDFRRMLIDCLEALRGYRLDYGDDPKLNKVITKEDLYKIYEYDTRKHAEEVFKAKDHKEKWKSLWEKKMFDNRKFLEDYFEVSGQKNSKIFAKIDSRLRRGANAMIQMSCLFDLIG